MRRRIRPHSLSRVVLVLLTVLAPISLSAATFPYTVENLGTLPGDASAVPFGINARGQVVGWSGYSRAFIFSDGAGMIELFGPGGRTSAIARAINDAGVVVGESSGGGLNDTAVRWTQGVTQDIGSPEVSSRAWDVSSAGIVVGDANSDAFMYTDTDGQVLLAPLHDNSVAYDINEVGQVTGYMTAAGAYHAFRFTPDSGVQDLGIVPGFAFSFGKAINVSGQVAGTATSGSGNSERVFRFTEGTGMVELGGVGQTNEVWAMNARGDFVGRGQPTSGLLRAFIYTDEGGLKDFSTLIDPALNLRVMYAHDINDAGQIAALAYEYVIGQWRAVRLSPTTPVGPLAALSTTTTKMETGASCTAWITLSQPAAAGGALISLTSTDATVASVPANITMPAGERQRSFAVVAGKSGHVQLTANYSGSTRSATLDVIPVTTDVRGSVPALRVHAVVPNPASGAVRLDFEMSKADRVRVSVYDVTGRFVRALFDAPQSAGLHTIAWDGTAQNGSTAPSGAYFMRIQAGGFQHSAKIVLVR